MMTLAEQSADAISAYRAEHGCPDACLRTMADGIMIEPEAERIGDYWIVPSNAPEARNEDARDDWCWRVLHAETGLAIGGLLCRDACVAMAKALPPGVDCLAAVKSGEPRANAAIAEAMRAADEVENAHEASVRAAENGALIAEELRDAEDELRDAEDEADERRRRVEELRAELRVARRALDEAGKGGAK